MKKLLLVWLVAVTFLFANIDLNSASKEQLTSIKGIGEKKAELILEYRKTHKINSASDLEHLKGFGPVLISNIKKNIKLK